MGQGDPGRQYQAGVIRLTEYSITPVPRMTFIQNSGVTL